MPDIRKLTRAYVAAFDARDLDAVDALLANDFSLTDPSVTGLTPKSAVLKFIGGLFEENDRLSFAAHQILADGDMSVIHFTLTLNDAVLDGVDVIEWKDGMMISMNAYLTARD